MLSWPVPFSSSRTSRWSSRLLWKEPHEHAVSGDLEDQRLGGDSGVVLRGEPVPQLPGESAAVGVGVAE